MNDAPLIASVAVKLPLHDVYSYLVDPIHRDLVAPGVRVLVPFGARRLTGYVIEVSSREEAAVDPSIRLKAILDVLDDTPRLTDELVGLAKWTATYYHAPLGEVLGAMLPAGIDTREVRTVTFDDEGARLLGLEVDRAYPMRTLAAERGGLSSVLAVVKAGHGRVAVTLEAPAIKPKLERIITFVKAVPLAERASKQRALLAAVHEARRVPYGDLTEAHGSCWPVIARLQALGAVAVEEERVFRQAQGDGVGTLADEGGRPTLTADQARVVDDLAPRVADGFSVTALHGVTGSGKTEVYLRLIEEARAKGKSALILAPEIALTPQLFARFEARLGADEVAVLHSALGKAARLDEWDRIREGGAHVVVGARSAIFAPLEELGLIVVDEEHETSYKQDDRVRYHARDLAVVRGRRAGALVVLGSATPSLETLHNASTGKYHLARLPARINARPLPAIEVVDMRSAPTIDSAPFVSEVLRDRLVETVSSGNQAMIFLNRRGYAPFLLCKVCGGIPECRHCSVSMTFHKGLGRLVCHMCGASAPVPSRCPYCGAPNPEQMGAGTERIEEIIADLVPDARVARLDRDTAKGTALYTILSDFKERRYDVLVGTQMIAKGHDFPHVTLVGILMADHGLKFPDFRAAEHAFSLLLQVAGRAGRSDKPGSVVLQTYDPRHYALVHLPRHDFGAFVDTELAIREERLLPPFSYLALVLFTHPSLPAAMETASLVRRHLVDTAHGIHLLGPAPAPLRRVKGQERCQLVIKGASRRVVQHAVGLVAAWRAPSGAPKVKISVDVDPLHLL